MVSGVPAGAPAQASDTLVTASVHLCADLLTISKDYETILRALEVPEKLFQISVSVENLIPATCKALHTETTLRSAVQVKELLCQDMVLDCLNGCCATQEQVDLYNIHKVIRGVDGSSGPDS
jgi:hypothetical protein